MRKIAFHGVVTPRHDALHVRTTLKGIDWARDGTDPIVGDIDITFASGMVVAVFSSESTADILEIRAIVKRHTQGLLDLYSFYHGFAMTLEFEYAYELDGERRNWHFNSRLPDESALPDGMTFEHVVQARNRSVALQNALANRRFAITYAWDTGLFCWRAIESIRHHFADPTTPEAKAPAWIAMRTALRLTTAWLEPVSNASLEQRHGAYNTYFSQAQRADLVNRVRIVIVRFIVFINAGAEGPIDATAFPEL